MAITLLPTPPTRSDPANFPARADSFLAALPTFGTEANALAVDVNAKQVTASAAATTATNASVAASAAQAAAQAASVASIWISGTTYAVGDVRFSPLDFKSYRRKTAGAGTTDPSADITNWSTLQAEYPYLHVVDQKASGTVGGTCISGFQFRTINTTLGTNTIAGSSLVSDTITLTAGTYHVEVLSVDTNSGNKARISLYNSTDSSDVLIGVGGRNAGDSGEYLHQVSGKFSITSTKSFKLRYYSDGVGSGSTALGFPISSGQAEIYSSIQIWKVA